MPVNDLLLLIFIITLFGLLIVIGIILIRYKKIVNKFLVIYLVLEVSIVSVSTAIGGIAILNSICFLREGQPYQKMPIESLQTYMLYTIVGLGMVIFLGFALIYITLKTEIMDKVSGNTKA